MPDPRKEVLIDYTNHRGERAWRRIRPQHVSFENNEFHHDTQWILYAEDLDKRAIRGFAMKDIHGWKAAQVEQKDADFGDAIEQFPMAHTRRGSGARS